MNRVFRVYDRQLRIRSTLFLAGLVLLPAFLTYGLAGPLWSVAVGVVLLVLGLVRAPASTILQGTLSVDEVGAHGLQTLVESLAARAGLSRVPEIRILPGGQTNAAATLHGNRPVLVVTEALLARLDARRLAAVLAHETAHLVHSDLLLFRLAVTLQAGTYFLGTFTASVAILTWPLNGFESVIWTFIALLSPLTARMLVAGLSRTREFAADLEAARLTGDPAALAQALAEIEYRPRTLWDWVWGTRSPLPSDPTSRAFRTHPPTPERVRRLVWLARGPS